MFGNNVLGIIFAYAHEERVRDLTELRRHDYHVDSIEPVDMFPHTKHVETVVLMTRAEGA